jgi:hypothetical protein
MKNYCLFLIIIFFLSTSSYAQKTHTTHKKHVYLTLNSYNQKYNTSFNEIDTKLIILRAKDTLVLDENYVAPNGIKVPYEYQDSTFLQYYKKVAFNHLKDSISKKTKMRYWKDDIKVFFSKSVSNKTRKKLMSFTKTLAKDIDSLNIYETKKVEQSNFIIYYFGDYEYESSMVNNKSSDYSMYWNGKSQIYKNAIKLDSKAFFNEELRLYELKRLFLQSLGYFKFINDFDCESYFSNCFSVNKHLTELDLALLKYHYSYGICKGIDLETFEEQHRNGKESLKKGHIMNILHPKE